MRKETVPIDMSSEQKTILGIVSKRQLIYIIVFGGIIYQLTSFMFSVFSNYIVAAIVSLICSIPFIVLAAVLGFFKKGKYHMYYDYYLLTRISRKSQYGKWRK